MLIVDTDPQCNLTGFCLSYSGEDNFENFYENKDIDNIKSALEPVFESNPEPLEPANCYNITNKEGLFLLPGHINFSEFDVSIGISQELTGSLKIMQNVPGAINYLLRKTAEKYEFDYVLIDMSPSVSATNANVLMQSDYFIVPCSPDYFCNMAVASLSRVIPNWDDTYEKMRNHSTLANADYKIAEQNPKFIGTIIQNFRLMNGKPTKSFQTWISRISNTVSNDLVPALEERGMLISKTKFKEVNESQEKYNIINIADFNSLIAQSQKYNVPVFDLKDEQIEQSGNVLKNMINNREKFHKTFTKLAKRVIQLTK